jgi:hypothetical protein
MTGDNFIMRRLMFCTAHTTLFREETFGMCGGKGKGAVRAVFGVEDCRKETAWQN